jgi:uncharacterized protein
MTRFGLSFWILSALVVAFGLVAYFRDPGLLGRALSSSRGLLGSVWVELALGFLLAGLLDVLLPRDLMSSWLGDQNLLAGTAIGWMAGLALPGGPYVAFPIAAGLWNNGAAPAPLIALLTAKTLVSPIRMVTYEAPLLGWPLALARFVPGVLMPPVLGLLGHWLYAVFKGRL